MLPFFILLSIVRVPVIDGVKRGDTVLFEVPHLPAGDESIGVSSTIEPLSADNEESTNLPLLPLEPYQSHLTALSPAGSENRPKSFAHSKMTSKLGEEQILDNGHVIYVVTRRRRTTATTATTRKTTGQVHQIAQFKSLKAAAGNINASVELESKKEKLDLKRVIRIYDYTQKTNNNSNANLQPIVLTIDGNNNVQQVAVSRSAPILDNQRVGTSTTTTQRPQVIVIRTKDDDSTLNLTRDQFLDETTIRMIAIILSFFALFGVAICCAVCPGCPFNRTS